MKKIISIVGARPNFMKIAPIHKELQKYPDKVKHIICHTGQHFDEKMSKVFFDELELPIPDYNLNIGSASHAVQTAKIMVAFEEVLLKEKPDLIIVVGDVNSTLACSLTASKLQIKIAHIESGLRSFDRSMPEEINRIMTDVISDFLFVSEDSGIKNLKDEGIEKSKFFFTGNIMIDSLQYYFPKINQSNIGKNFNLNQKAYILLTFHRPNNVDSKNYLTSLINFINSLAAKRKVIFPMHPRTQNKIKEYDFMKLFHPNAIITDPLGYFDFISLIKNAELVITDSGGIQEESTYLKTPCITVRDNTERPSTVTVGSNYLAGRDLNNVLKIADDILDGKMKEASVPELWDGKTAERICSILSKKLNF